MEFMDKDQIKQRLGVLISELTQLVEDLDAGDPTLPPEAIEKMRNSICLFCEKKIKKSQSSRRGDHESCYRVVMRQIQNGEITEDQAIRAGLIAPKERGGRPRSQPTSLDRIVKPQLRELDLD